MATVTEAASMTVTQTCAKAGLSESKQYTFSTWVMTATIVMTTLMRQYWNTQNQITLNQVNPLLGVLSSPLSPPVHFRIQDTGQIQGIGVSVLKYSFCPCKSGATKWHSSAKKLAIAKAS